MPRTVLVSALMLVFGLLLSCAGPSPTPEAQGKIAGQFGKQHIAVMSLAAWYYCEYSAWPLSLDDLKEFDEEKDRIPQAPRDWPWLLGPDVRLTTSDRYQLQSRYEIAEDDFRVMRSGQSAPLCEPGSTELQNSFVNLIDYAPF